MSRPHHPPSAIVIRAVLCALAVGVLSALLAGCGGSGHSSKTTALVTTAGSQPTSSAASGTATTPTVASSAKRGTTTTGARAQSGTRAAGASVGASTGTGGGGTAATGDQTTKNGKGDSRHGAANDPHHHGAHGSGSESKPVTAPAPSAGSGSGSAPNATNGVPYEVRTAAMEPTYKPFSTVYYDPTQTHPQIGQVILFYLPAGAEEGTCASPEVGGQACAVASPGVSQTLSLARVVGLPGEQIAIVNGLVVRNGQAVSEPSAQPCGEKELANEPGCEYPKAITVPAESYYVMADNRQLFQDDSRAFGGVPQAAVAGTLLGS